MKLKYLVVTTLVLSVLFCGFVVHKNVVNEQNQVFNVQVYQEQEGYGYSIQYKEKILIKQGFIPAIQNNKPFCSYNDAYKVASLVVHKLTKQQNPKISLPELKQLNIQINCVN